MNECMIVGKIAGRIFASKSVTKFKIATDMGYDPQKHGEKKAYVPITVFHLSEWVKESLFEGALVRLTGFISENSFQKDGNWIKQTSVYADPKSVHLP